MSHIESLADILRSAHPWVVSIKTKNGGCVRWLGIYTYRTPLAVFGS